MSKHYSGVPVSRKPASSFEADLQNSVLRKSSRLNVVNGPIKDLLQSISEVVASINNDTLRSVSLQVARVDVSEIDTATFDTIALTEGIVKPQGSQSFVIQTFRRTTPFLSTENGIIPKGTPVSTSGESGEVIFITTEARDKSTAVATISDNNQIVYDNDVPCVSLQIGNAQAIAPNRITKMRRNVPGYTSTFNKEASIPGSDTYTNQELNELINLAVSSRQLSVPQGNELFVALRNAAVKDVREVFGTDPLLTRPEDAGAVDTYIKGSLSSSQTENVTYVSQGQTYLLSLPPVLSITQVTNLTSPATYVEGTDFELRLDDSDYAGSARARDGIRFLPNGTLPASGDVLSVTYRYENLIRSLQSDNDTNSQIKVTGRNQLYKLGVSVPIYLEAELRVYGYAGTTIRSQLQNALIIYINSTLGLGGRPLGTINSRPVGVEVSDIQKEIRKYAGVDNFRITRMTRDPSEVSVVDDIILSGKEYPFLDLTSLVITLVN